MAELIKSFLTQIHLEVVDMFDEYGSLPTAQEAVNRKVKALSVSSQQYRDVEGHEGRFHVLGKKANPSGGGYCLLLIKKDDPDNYYILSESGGLSAHNIHYLLPIELYTICAALLSISGH